jgi:hypothetical protein
LWAGLNDDGRRLAEVLRRSEFPDENIQLVDLRQACAEKRVADAREFFDDSMASQREDPSTKYIALQVMGRPDEAHQLLVDSDLDVYALASFLNYPYFNHTYFPELAAILERQRIDRPFVSGPPYACAANQS